MKRTLLKLKTIIKKAVKHVQKYFLVYMVVLILFDVTQTGYIHSLVLVLFIPAFVSLYFYKSLEDELDQMIEANKKINKGLYEIQRAKQSVDNEYEKIKEIRVYLENLKVTVPEMISQEETLS